MRQSRALLSPGAALLAGAAILSLAAPGTGGAGSIRQLRAERAALAAREQRTVLDLYALDSRLDSARRLVASLDGQRRVLERERRDAALRLAAARRTLGRARAALGNQLLALYEQAAPDTLAIVLGAASLTDAIDGIDNLRSATSATEAVIRQATAAGRRVSGLAATLAARERGLSALARNARQEAAALAGARAARGAYLADLRRRDAAQAQALAGLEAQARQAAARARAAAARAAADASVTSFVARAPLAAPPPPPPPPPASPASPAVQAPAGGGRTLVVVTTGYALPGTTATGLPVGRGIAAVDPTVIPLGTRMEVPGYGEAVAADTGSAITGVRVDLWFPTVQEALAWGWRTLTVTLG